MSALWDNRVAYDPLDDWLIDLANEQRAELTNVIEAAYHKTEQLQRDNERLRNALTDALGHGETMPCGHNSRWLVYGNPVDLDSERHCLFCEVERLQAIVDKALPAIDGALKIAPCWLPPADVPAEHQDEAAAVHLMHDAFCEVIEAARTEVGE